MKFHDKLDQIKASYLTEMQGSVVMRHSNPSGTPTTTDRMQNPNQPKSNSSGSDVGNTDQDLNNDGEIDVPAMILRLAETDDDAAVDELDNYFNGLGIQDRAILGKHLGTLSQRYSTNGI